MRKQHIIKNNLINVRVKNHIKSIKKKQHSLMLSQLINYFNQLIVQAKYVSKIHILMVLFRKSILFILLKFQWQMKTNYWHLEYQIQKHKFPIIHNYQSSLMSQVKQEDQLIENFQLIQQKLYEQYHLDFFKYLNNYFCSKKLNFKCQSTKFYKKYIFNIKSIQIISNNIFNWYVFCFCISKRYRVMGVFLVYYINSINQYLQLTYISNMKNKEIGKYQYSTLVGQGSFGKVYKGVDRQTNQQVALKFISRKGKTKRDLEGLKQQIEILKKLKHQNIIQLKDHIQTATQIILVTQFAGKDLALVMQKQKKFKLQQIKNYMRQIISALLYLSQNRIVHRDLKPQNILIKQNTIKLCDFGFARKMSAATVCLYSLKGTPLYIAPQIISQKPYNHKIDIWSLGIILYQMYTGATPFFAETYYKLLPKILHDKVRYPKDIDLELRQLIEGMLQKNPNFRYDWPQIREHPFIKKQQKPLLDITDNNSQLKQTQKSYLVFDQQFPIESLLLKSSHLMKQNNKVQIQQLKQYQQQIKKNPQSANCHQLKTNLIFYHKMVTLFSMYSFGQKISKQHLIIAFRVISLLVTKVKLNNPQTIQQDITKKKDLILTVIKIILVVQQQDLLSQVYIIIAYLLKNIFDSVQLDNQISEQIIYSSSNILMRQKLPINLFVNILKVIGILANQAMITYQTSEQFFIIVNQSKLLEVIASKIGVQKQYSIVFECLQKFIHPLKGQVKSTKLLRIFNGLKKDVAKGFLQRGIVNVIKGVEGYSQSQYFYHIFYECIKVSSEFRKSFLGLPKKLIQPILLKNKIYSLAINYFLMKQQKTQMYNLQAIKQQMIQVQWNEPQIVKLFEIYIIFQSNLSKPDSKNKIQINKFIIKKIAQLITLDQQVKIKSVDNIQGWAYGYPSFTFDDIIIEIVSTLSQQQKSFETDLMRSSMTLLLKIFDNLIKIKNGSMNVSSQSLSKLFPIIINYIKQFGTNKKFINSLVQSFNIVLSQESLISLHQEFGDQFFLNFMWNVFTLIKQINSKDQKKLSDFYLKTQNLNFYRILFKDVLIHQKILGYSLSFLTKILQKGQSVILDYVAVQGLPKLKKYFLSTNNDIINDIVQIVSQLARSKVDYYPRIANLGIVQCIPKYLSSNIYNQSIKQKSLNLIGNLSKYNISFFDDFAKYKILSYIPNLILNTSNFQRIIKNVIYAIGNISFYNQQFRQEIKPLIPYLYQALFINQQHLLTNDISTLSNLLRHSNAYLKDLINYKVIFRIFEIVQTTKNAHILTFSFGFLQKAIQYNELFYTYPKDEIFRIVQSINLSGLGIERESESYKKYKRILQKLR